MGRYRPGETVIFKPWLNFASLAVESQHVIWLRMLKLGGGGANAGAEAQLMVSEKMVAAVDAAGRLMLGETPDRVISGYRRKVRANARRLTR